LIFDVIINPDFDLVGGVLALFPRCGRLAALTDKMEE
jgi:hypothetical protein